MAQPKTAEPTEALTSEERWERYRQMALTPEQVAEGRARVQRRSTELARQGCTKNSLNGRGRFTGTSTSTSCEDREFDRD